MSPYHQNRDTRGLAGKRAEQFERNIRKFMESTDTDRDLEEKVRRRLIEISNFVVKNRKITGPKWESDRWLRLHVNRRLKTMEKVTSIEKTTNLK